MDQLPTGTEIDTQLDDPEEIRRQKLIDQGVINAYIAYGRTPESQQSQQSKPTPHKRRSLGRSATKGPIIPQGPEFRGGMAPPATPEAKAAFEAALPEIRYGAFKHRVKQLQALEGITDSLFRARLRAYIDKHNVTDEEFVEWYARIDAEAIEQQAS